MITCRMAGRTAGIAAPHGRRGTSRADQAIPAAVTAVPAATAAIAMAAAVHSDLTATPAPPCRALGCRQPAHRGRCRSGVRRQSTQPVPSGQDTRGGPAGAGRLARGWVAGWGVAGWRVAGLRGRAAGVSMSSVDCQGHDSRIVTAVALYGRKTGALRSFLAEVQSLIAGHLGEHFRPYSLEQIHATLIILTGVTDPRTGALVNRRRLEQAGIAREMDLALAMRILTGHLRRPIRVRIGGWQPGQHAPFRSRGRHPYERSFSVQNGAFVLVGWPVAALAGPERPLDRLRRDMSAAGVFHRYHTGGSDTDDDLHLVVGHHHGAPPGDLDRAVRAVREWLAGHPVELGIGRADVKVVAADSPGLMPARFAAGIPVDEATLRGLMS